MILETLLGLAMSAQVSAADNDLPTTITYQGKSICVYKAAGAPPIFCKKLETGCPVKLVCKLQSKELKVQRAKGVVNK
jgi:hypothetical protein